MVPQTAFISTETYSQKTFERWLKERSDRDINRYELVQGRIVMTPPASWEHGAAEAATAREIGSHVARERLGETFGSSVGYRLPSGDIVEPDFSYIAARAWREATPPAPGTFLHIVPTLAVEILSPSSALRDRTEKKRIYESNGALEYWLVDLKGREVQVYILRTTRYGRPRRFRADERIRSEVLPKLTVRASQILR